MRPSAKISLSLHVLSPTASSGGRGCRCLSQTDFTLNHPHYLPQRVGWFVALATDRQEHSYGGGGVHSRIQHWMQPHWHMHVSKAASALAAGVPVGNVMGLHCLLQSQATVTLHMEKRAKEVGSSNNAEANAPPTSVPTIHGGTAAGDM